MALPYTVSFGRAFGAVPGSAKLFITPDADAWIVRDLVVANLGSVAGIISVFVQSGSDRYELHSVSVEPSKSSHGELRQRLLPGDEIFVVSALEAWSVAITGYHLDD